MLRQEVSKEKYKDIWKYLDMTNRLSEGTFNIDVLFDNEN